MIRPSWVPTSCALSTPLLLEVWTNLANSYNEETWVTLYTFLIKPKDRSGPNFVCPAIRKEYVIERWSFSKILYVRYQRRKLFLFWPAQLSAWRCAWCSPSPWLFNHCLVHVSVVQSQMSNVLMHLKNRPSGFTDQQSICVNCLKKSLTFLIRVPVTFSLALWNVQMFLVSLYTIWFFFIWEVSSSLQFRRVSLTR